MSLFISFEGCEGAGKTTQVARLAERLDKDGYDVITVREPGGTQLGQEVRRWVKGVGVAPNAELLLFAAARAALVAKVIKPSLAEGKVVIADRYADSTMAYQGYGRRLSLDIIRAVNDAATSGLVPKLTLLLDQPPEVGLTRVGEPQLGLALDSSSVGRPGRAEEFDKSVFEKESIAFHRRVRSGFLKLAREDTQRLLVIDASQSPNHIAHAIWQRVHALLRLMEHETTPQ